MSSSGENIEFSAKYSIDLASMFFEDFARENTRLSIGRDSSLFLLGDTLAPYFKKRDLEAKSKQAIFDLCLDLDLLDYNAGLNDFKKAELISDLLKISNLRFYEYLISANSWHELGENIAHSFYISRGYSQGDAVYIVSLDKPIDNAMRENIDRILWDCPLSIYCQVNDQEFFEDDFLTDFYAWDREAVAEKVKTLHISESAKAWIVEALPEYPDYQ